MTIKDICKVLDISRQGLYYILATHPELSQYAQRTEKGRWIVQDTALPMLRKIRAKNAKVIAEPANKDAINRRDAKIQELEAKVRNLTKQLELAEVKAAEGELLASGIDDVLQDFKGADVKKLTSEIRRQVKHFTSRTRPRALASEAKKRREKRRREEFEASQTSLFEGL
jgi:hypothetical protein